MATERSLERVGVDRFDLLLLHDRTDRIGYTSPAVWEGMAALRDAGLTPEWLGVAPGPANGFTLDLIDCLERFGELIDWAMVILNPLEPWPRSSVLPAARRYGIDVITRVVDYGGLFWDDVGPAMPSPSTTIAPSGRRLGPGGASAWSDAPDRRAPRADDAAARVPAEPGARPVRSPSRRSSRSPGAEADQGQRAELAAVPRELVLSDAELAEIRAIGDNTGSMTLKGASPQFEGEPQPDRWPLTDDLTRSPRAGRSPPSATWHTPPGCSS